MHSTVRDRMIEKLIEDEWDVQAVPCPSFLLDKKGNLVNSSAFSGGKVHTVRAFRLPSENPNPRELYIDIIKTFDKDVKIGHTKFYIHDIYPSVYFGRGGELFFDWLVRYYSK